MINLYSDSDFINSLGRGESCYKESPDDFFQSPQTYHDLREYYHRRLGPSWSVSSKKSAIELLTVDNYLLRGVIIQQMGKFYVFVDDFVVDDPSLEEFEGYSAVNEIIPKQRCRYPTVDIDSKTPSLAELLLY